MSDVSEMYTPQLLIGGEWRDASDGGRFEVHDPADGSVLAEVADGQATDATAALDAAATAQRDWAATPARERAEILRRAFELLTERSEDFARLMSLEMGKNLTESAGEVAYGAEFFRWFAEEAVRVHGRWMDAPAGGSKLVTVRRPVGPCLLITPWNFPLAMGTRKVGAALAAGCTMVLKPAGATPLTALALARVLAEAGLPDGVLNVVTSSRASRVSEPLLADPRLRKLSFTGSTDVGRLLMRQASDGLLRVSMELGGNAPFLVFDDADVPAAVEGAMLAKMRNIGEACTSANRFLVHEHVAEAFTAGLTERMSGLRSGRGQDEGVDVGPLIDTDAREKVHDLVTEAIADGARLLTGGEIPDGEGAFYPPTVLADVPTTSRISRTEIFGPVAAISTFSHEDEAIALANDTEYGLVSYAYTAALDRTIRLTERLDYGMVGINTGLLSNPAAPFGGVKASGFGREGGFEGIDEYLETRYVGLPAGD